uniref:Uncharacterized protein n=1 Tax=Eutreptiella gymnastica TaxID=73025 RepID=A0A7S4C9N4_9EUGL
MHRRIRLFFGVPASLWGALAYTLHGTLRRWHANVQLDAKIVSMILCENGNARSKFPFARTPTLQQLLRAAPATLFFFCAGLTKGLRTGDSERVGQCVYE